MLFRSKLKILCGLLVTLSVALFLSVLGLALWTLFLSEGMLPVLVDGGISVVLVLVWPLLGTLLVTLGAALLVDPKGNNNECKPQRTITEYMSEAGVGEPTDPDENMDAERNTIPDNINRVRESNYGTELSVNGTRQEEDKHTNALQRLAADSHTQAVRSGIRSELNTPLQDDCDDVFDREEHAKNISFNRKRRFTSSISLPARGNGETSTEQFSQIDHYACQSESQTVRIKVEGDHTQEEVTEGLLVTSHPFHLSRKHCQRLSAGVVVMVAVGFFVICFAISIVKWILFTAVNHLDNTWELFLVARTMLSILCPILAMVGCTLLGIALSYATCGQVDGKRFIVYLLPMVKMATVTTMNKPARKLQFWTFSTGACIAINKPRGRITQLRRYLDTTPATWVLMLIIYISVLVSTGFFVDFGVVIRKDFNPTSDDCSKYNWHCYEKVNTMQGGAVACGHGGDTSNVTEELICYRFSDLSELEDVGVALGGALAVYLVSTYFIPYLIRIWLLLEKLKTTKLWALPPLVLGCVGTVGTLALTVFYPSSSVTTHSMLVSLCLIAIGILVALSRTQVIIYPPEVQRSVIVQVDCQDTYKIAMRLQTREMEDYA